MLNMTFTLHKKTEEITIELQRKWLVAILINLMCNPIYIVLIYFHYHSVNNFLFSHSLTPENEKQQHNETNSSGNLLQSHPVNEFEIHHIRNSKN